MRGTYLAGIHDDWAPASEGPSGEPAIDQHRSVYESDGLLAGIAS